MIFRVFLLNRIVTELLCSVSRQYRSRRYNIILRIAMVIGDRAGRSLTFSLHGLNNLNKNFCLLFLSYFSMWDEILRNLWASCYCLLQWISSPIRFISDDLLLFVHSCTTWTPLFAGSFLFPFCHVKVIIPIDWEPCQRGRKSPRFAVSCVQTFGPYVVSMLLSW